MRESNAERYLDSRCFSVKKIEQMRVLGVYDDYGLGRVDEKSSDIEFDNSICSDDLFSIALAGSDDIVKSPKRDGLLKLRKNHQLHGSKTALPIDHIRVTRLDSSEGADENDEAMADPFLPSMYYNNEPNSAVSKRSS